MEVKDKVNVVGRGYVIVVKPDCEINITDKIIFGENEFEILSLNSPYTKKGNGTWKFKQLNIGGSTSGYDAEGKLAAFDTTITQNINSVVVRKDILDSFLAQTGWKLVWLVDAEKEIHAGDFSLICWSDWESCLYMKETIL